MICGSIGAYNLDCFRIRRSWPIHCTFPRRQNTLGLPMLFFWVIIFLFVVLRFIVFVLQVTDAATIHAISAVNGS